ncbi:MAG TPA: phage holin family protein [Candidatus Cottocaccamicrobium excrementipullorum]|nr:phage holin family protein [Candidatus Cottocaccamicrobium excrementipullorum]
MKFLDRCNAIYGAVITVLTAVFGVYWYVFAAYLLCNVCDYITGWWKARKLKQESSRVGLNGILKKCGYWLIVLVAFLIPEVFVHLGNDLLGIDLAFLMLLGWFTLATLLINEIRSILENLVECGCEVPEFLIAGLAVTEKLLDAEIKIPGMTGESEEYKNDEQK